MAWTRLDMTASSAQDNTAPSSSYSTSVTMKCFSRLSGFTAVHLLLSNFLGLIWFTTNSSSPVTPYDIANHARHAPLHPFGRPDPRHSQFPQFASGNDQADPSPLRRQ